MVTCREPVVEGKPRVPGIGKRYLTSMFYVLNALEHALTNHEMLFALFAELMRDFILGLVAGLMATISMAAGDNDQEQLFKLRDMKVWMSDREVPKSFRCVDRPIYHLFTGTATQYAANRHAALDGVLLHTGILC